MVSAVGINKRQGREKEKLQENRYEQIYEQTSVELLKHPKVVSFNILTGPQNFRFPVVFHNV